MRTPPLCRTALALATLLLLASCETTSTSSAPSSATPPASPVGQATTTSRGRPPQEPAWLSLERTRTDSGAAAGPVYVVTLFEDGKVIFEGHAAVKHKGTFSKVIPRAQASAVFGQVEILNLWQRERRFDVERVSRGGDNVIGRTASTEVPWDIIRVRRHGQMLRIDGLFFAPHDILAFKQLVEKTVDLPAWIGEPHEWQK